MSEYEPVVGTTGSNESAIEPWFISALAQSKCPFHCQKEPCLT
jgi:hypothetical protein